MPVETPSKRAAESQEVTIETWRRRKDDSLAAQKTMHGIWATNLAFSAGQFWLAWDTKQNKLRSIREVDPAYENRELFTANRIREYVQAQLGELSSEDERPQLLTAQEGEDAESIAESLNRMVEYAWDHEWNADSTLLKARRLTLDLGVSAIRCRWDPAQGKLVDRAVMQNGQPVTDQDALAHLQEHGALPDGSLPRYKPVREGRTVWDVYSAYQLLTPPGVVHEDDFPWEGVFRAVPIEDIEDVYGIKVDEDTDIANTVGLPNASATQSGQNSQGRLRGHAWLYTCFDRPCGRYPEGRKLVFAGNDMKLCNAEDMNGLDYKHGDEPHTGLVYLHWWRLSDRFQSQSFVEPLKDPQRMVNKRRVQKNEWLDRAMPKILTYKGDFDGGENGQAMEIVEMEQTARPPVTFMPPSPGSMFEQDVQSLEEDLSHASTLSLLRLGENPENVGTYGQLALLNDNEHGKRQTVQGEHRQAEATLVELSVADIKKYWPEQKRALIQGDDDRIEQVTFEKSQIPDEFRVKVAKGAPLPKSQGAQIKKIEAVMQAAVETGLVAQDPSGWTSWFSDSLDAGSKQDLPVTSPSSQQQVAHLENLEMRQGEEVMPAYYDQLPQHIPVHREEEDQARAAGDVELASRIERHIQAHLAVSLAVAQATGPQVPPPGEPPMGPGAAPPGPPAGPPPQQ